MPPTAAYALTMLAAGIGIPLLAALNAALGQRIASPLAAGVILFVVALAFSLIVAGISGIHMQSHARKNGIDVNNHWLMSFITISRMRDYKAVILIHVRLRTFNLTA